MLEQPTSAVGLILVDSHPRTDRGSIRCETDSSVWQTLSRLAGHGEPVSRQTPTGRQFQNACTTTYLEADLEQLVSELEAETAAFKKQVAAARCAESKRHLAGHSSRPRPR